MHLDIYFYSPIGFSKLILKTEDSLSAEVGYAVFFFAGDFCTGDLLTGFAVVCFKDLSFSIFSAAAISFSNFLPGSLNSFCKNTFFPGFPQP